tara:strand:+ start:1432 stop:1551 length:120 start_codon:yes stop_codon:yes gene_type:complete
MPIKFKVADVIVAITNAELTFRKFNINELTKLLINNDIK